MSNEAITPEVRFKEFTNGWEKLEFPVAFEFPVTTNSLSRSQLNYDKGEIKSIHYGDILVNYNAILDVTKDKIPFITNGILRDYKSNLLANGDIVFADASEDEMVGKAVEVNGKNDKKIVSGLHTIVARPKKDMAEYFLGYYINSNLYHNQLLKMMQGTKVLSISKKNLKKTTIAFPENLNEQQKVGSFLKRTDDIINLRQQELTKIKNIKQAMLERLFPKEDESVPEMRFKDFKNEWIEYTLNDVGMIVTGNTPPTNDTMNYSSRGTLWVTPTDIKSPVTKNTEKRLSVKGENKARIVPKGSILVTCIASLGKNTLVLKKSGLNQQINAIIPKNGFDSYFLLALSYHWSNKMKKIAGAGTMDIVNRTEFTKIITRIPSYAEQKQIGRYFEQMDNMISAKKAELQKLKQFKQAMLSKLFV